MKKSILVLIAAIGFFACNRPEPSYEGVLMTNYGKDGLSSFNVCTGAQGPLGPGSELYQVPMWEQMADPDSYAITTKNSGVFTIDPRYQYEAIRGQGPSIIFNYKRYSSNDGDEFMNAIESNILNIVVQNAYQETAGKYTTDSLMNNRLAYEKEVESILVSRFIEKGFNLKELTSGLTPPLSMQKAIEAKNNSIQEAERVRNELQVAKLQQEKAFIEQETNRIKSQGYTKEILTAQWIDAIRHSNNKIVITDGKTPLIIQSQ